MSDTIEIPDAIVIPDTIVIRKLTPDFHKENDLAEMIDRGAYKVRGYGVLLVEVKGYKFAIPLRSKMNIGQTKSNYTTRIWEDGGKRVRHGLDFSKAVIIKEDRYVSDDEFFLAVHSDAVKIREKQHHIITKFTKYVEKYIEAVQADKQNILERDYKYSTLQNYHAELCQ